jgi:O-antigen ligase
LFAAVAGCLSVLSRSQPPRRDLAPLVHFLTEPAQRPYRYLTLGFGDQFARLSALTGNGSVDGNYHTARELPELRASGLGALDGAVWNPQGAWALRPFLERGGEYGVRWAFVNHPAYVPVLQATGWRFRWMVGEVAAWEQPDVRPRPLVIPPQDLLAARWWGIAPLTALVLTLGLFVLEQRRLRSISRADVIQALAKSRIALWALTLMLLCLSWVHVVRTGPFPEVYFVYQSVMLFVSDVAVVFTLLIWAVERGLRREPLRLGPRPVGYAGLGLIAACALSVVVSQDRAVSLALTAHLALLGGLYLLCVNDPPPAALVGRLFGGVLLAQAVVALVEVGLQSTHWLRDLYLMWPGSLAAADSGASVVQNIAGQRWLRAYGTLPHPNILGGVVLICLGAAAERFWEEGRRLWLVLVALGAITLALTFSRSAWVGMGAMLLGGAVLLRRAGPARARPILLTGLVALALTLAPLFPFLLARMELGEGRVALEHRSVADRARLWRAGGDVIRSHLLLGVGAGTFVESLARMPGPPIVFEPVHNIPLLVTAETGLPGGLAAVALGAAVLGRMWRRRRSAPASEAMWALAVLGMLTVGQFDHYWWTLPPMRTLFVMALGLWAASARSKSVT